MHKKNKITLVAAHAKRPFPDCNNTNRIGTASIEINDIKRYLKAVKNNHEVGTLDSYQAA